MLSCLRYPPGDTHTIPIYLNLTGENPPPRAHTQEHLIQEKRHHYHHRSPKSKSSSTSRFLQLCCPAIMAILATQDQHPAFYSCFDLQSSNPILAILPFSAHPCHPSNLCLSQPYLEHSPLSIIILQLSEPIQARRPFHPFISFPLNSKVLSWQGFQVMPADGSGSTAFS